MAADVVLETRGLAMHFGGVVAVDDVDFLLRERELRCLIGPNGAGKSTFFKCLTGLLRPTRGDILLLDRPIVGRDAFWVAQRGVGVKTQSPSVFNGLSVRENIWLSARRRFAGSEAEERVDAMLERLRLADLRHAAVGQLAHGQRQSVEIGMVIVGEPWLVLLDEPAAGMTHDEVERMVELIRDINRTATMIIVEHDMQFIRMIANRVTVFHQGAILMEDHVDVVLNDERVRDVYLGK